MKTNNLQFKTSSTWRMKLAEACRLFIKHFQGK